MLQILNYYNDFQRDYDERVADIRTFGHTFIREWPMYGHSDSLLYVSGHKSDIRVLLKHLLNIKKRAIT